MSWADFRRGAMGQAQAASAELRDLADPRSRNDLIFYLVGRFIIVLVAVMLVESAVVWLESVTLAPLLASVVSAQVTRMSETTSLLDLMRWAGELLVTLLQPSSIFSTGTARRSLGLVLLVTMLMLLAVPVLVGAFAFAWIVVRRVRLMQERRERELAQIERERSQFITDVAHDLRTPLMAISGMAHALEDGLVRGEAQRQEYLSSICDKADSMGTLVNTVFDFTKLGSGSFELNLAPVDLAQLALHEAATAYTDAEDAGMLLTTSIPEERCLVLADEVQLSRVVANLIGNAIRHNDAGCEVAVILVRQAGCVWLMVADTGEALTQTPDELFRPFSRGDASRSRGRIGSGLGLSICKRVADMHGFDLDVAQPYGRFAKAFVLRCPLAE